jgi:hypothetical protein
VVHRDIGRRSVSSVNRSGSRVPSVYVCYFFGIIFISSRLWGLGMANACVYVHGCVRACMGAYVRMRSWKWVCHTWI